MGLGDWMRRLWCRYKACGAPFDSVAGDLPQTCPACGGDGNGEALWTTEEPAPDPEPKHGWVLSFMDKRFLHSLRIAVDEPQHDVMGT